MRKRLLKRENVNGSIHSHSMVGGDDGRSKLLTESFQDAAPHIRRAKQMAEIKRQNPGSEVRHQASIPANLVNHVCYSLAPLWGSGAAKIYQELVAGKTDRAQHVGTYLAESRDFRKLQSKSY